MREIGLNPRTGGGKRGDAKRLHDQMERLFRSTITFEDRREWDKSYVDMQVAPRGQFWWDPSRAHQDNLWESWVELGEDFFAAITAAPVPVDMRALRGLKRSPLALDLYALLTHTAFAAGRKGISRSIPWEGLHTQRGAEYALLRQFRAMVVAALRRIQTVYPAVKVETTEDALSGASVAARNCEKGLIFAHRYGETATLELAGFGLSYGEAVTLFRLL